MANIKLSRLVAVCVQSILDCRYPTPEPIDIIKVFHGLGYFRIPVIILMREISGSTVKPARILNFDPVGKPIKTNRRIRLIVTVHNRIHQ